MTHAVGLADAEPRHVLAGIVDLLNGKAGTPEAERWAAACSMSGACIDACNYGVNPRIMVRLAHFANIRRRAGDTARGNATRAFRGMARAVRIVSRLQLGESVLTKLQPPIGRFAWRGWTFDWEASPGEHELACRATDADGNVQPLDMPWNYGGMGNNGAQTVRVTVRAAPR